jgi:hypothetical protein
MERVGADAAIMDLDENTKDKTFETSRLPEEGICETSRDLPFNLGYFDG